jgi:hypothetical protein
MSRAGDSKLPSGPGGVGRAASLLAGASSVAGGASEPALSRAGTYGDGGGTWAWRGHVGDGAAGGAAQEFSSSAAWAGGEGRAMHAAVVAIAVADFAGGSRARGLHGSTCARVLGLCGARRWRGSTWQHVTV